MDRLETYMAKENVWKVLSQPWSPEPRVSLGRTLKVRSELAGADREDMVYLGCSREVRGGWMFLIAGLLASLREAIDRIVVL
jgi:hypothetical protein